MYFCKPQMNYIPGNNFPGIASQFAMHFLLNCYTKYLLVAVFFHRSVQNFIWSIYSSAEIANQIWGGKLFPVYMYIVIMILISLSIWICTLSAVAYGRGAGGSVPQPNIFQNEKFVNLRPMNIQNFLKTPPNSANIIPKGIDLNSSLGRQNLVSQKC